MRKSLFAIVGTAILLLWSCGHKTANESVSGNAVLQAPDGSFALNMDKAACYSDLVNPSSNTAEWNVVVSKPGRFKVWLSSATRDTTNLSYVNSVKISLLDNLLEATPEPDRVVLNSKDVSYPYYQTDSYMGSFYISDPGEYRIQVISEKVLSKEARQNGPAGPDNTKLMSVILTPMTR
jgi:hypothetical protein